MRIFIHKEDVEIIKRNAMFLLLISITGIYGCVAVIGAGAGASTVAYMRGELHTTFAASFNRTWDATISALRDLGITIYNTKKDATEGDIEATKADGTKVKVNLKPKGKEVTEV